MKKLVLIPLFACVLTACTSTKFDIDIRPEETNDTAPTAVVWSKDNDAKLKAATSDDIVSTIAATEANSLTLLGKLKGAYATDPYVMVLVGAVSQWVMANGRDAARRTWTDALLKTAETASDDYVKMTCLDQLRWCGDGTSVARIRTIGAKGGPSVRDFAAMVERELTGKSIGL